MCDNTLSCLPLKEEAWWGMLSWTARSPDAWTCRRAAGAGEEGPLPGVLGHPRAPVLAAGTAAPKASPDEPTLGPTSLSQRSLPSHHPPW